MLKNRKKLFIILSLFVSISVIAWFAFFSYGTQWLEGEVTLAMEKLRRNGYVISYSKLTFSGHPLAIQATFQNPQVKDSQGFVEWQGQELKVIMRPWDFYTLRCNLQGAQKLAITPFSSLPLEILYLEETSGIVHLSHKGRLDKVSLTVGHLSSVLGNQPQLLCLKDLSLHVSNITDPLNLKLSLSTHLENVEKLLKKAPTGHPFTITVVADLAGFKPEFAPPKSLAEWRNGGGILEVRRLSVDWPPILAEIEGTITFDGDMYPLGSFSSKISGYREAISNMVELGWIKKKKAAVALFMLDLFSSSDEKGGKYLKAPITLQNKVLSVGPAPLMKLKPMGGSEDGSGKMSK